MLIRDLKSFRPLSSDESRSYHRDRHQADMKSAFRDRNNVKLESELFRQVVADGRKRLGLG